MEDWPRLHRARTVKVLTPNSLEADIDVGFGIKVTRRVKFESIGDRFVPKDLRSRAMHALVVLCGGKDLYVQADPSGVEGCVTGRVFVASRVRSDGPWMFEPYGLETKYLEVSSFMEHLKSVQFDVEEVKRVLNGKTVNG